MLAWGGAYEYFGVRPDLFCLAKSIGGGIPIGAFGGKREVMRVIETLEGSQHHAGMGGATGESMIEHSTLPSTATRVAHLGTFNGNPLSMTAGLVTLTQILVKDAYPKLHALADRLTAGCAEVLAEYELPGYAINVGPKGCVMFTPERVTNYRDFSGLDAELWEAFFFYLANRGILLPPGSGRPVDAVGPAHRGRDRAPHRRIPRVRRRTRRLIIRHPACWNVVRIGMPRR